jgi:hypothetical protein
MPAMPDHEERRRLLESEIERRLTERFAALREEFERLRLESDGRWAGFASRFEQRISGIVPAELLAAGEPVPRADGGRLSIQTVRELDASSTQVEILLGLLDHCRRHASRAILLVLRNGALGVWKTAGLAGGAEEEALVGRVTLAVDGAVARVADGVPCRLAPDNDVSRRLSCADATDAVLIPMVVGEKIAGALYADAAPGEEGRFDPDAVALLVFLSGFLVDRLPLRKLKPSPGLRLSERYSAHPEPEDAYDTQALRIWRDPATLEPAAPSSPAPGAPEPARSQGAADTPPPAAPRRLSGPLAPTEDDERRAEARRFAQLLVSEIKLYNEHAVEEGRAQGNLYKRLKEEIDLSRQMYEERIPESVRAGSDFLYEELVRILADGRAEALGI